MKKSILFFAVFFIFMSVSVLSFALDEKDQLGTVPAAESVEKAGGDEMEQETTDPGEGDKDMEEVSQKVYAVENPNHTQILGGKSESPRRLERACERSDRINKINAPKPEDPGDVAKPGKGNGRGKNKGKDHNHGNKKR